MNAKENPNGKRKLYFLKTLSNTSFTPNFSLTSALLGNQ